MSERSSREQRRKSKKTLRHEAIQRSKIKDIDDVTSKSDFLIPDREDYTAANVLDCVRGQLR